MKEIKQFLRELDELGNKELFHAYHPAHMEERHICVSDKDLWRRLWDLPKAEDELICYSRFYGNIEQVLPLLQETILQDVKHLESWDPGRGFHVICKEFPEPIGEGIVQAADWHTLFPMSSLRIILGASDIPGRIFQVVTAYPEFTMDEVDGAWDAVEEFQEKQKKRKNREKKEGA